MDICSIYLLEMKIKICGGHIIVKTDKICPLAIPNQISTISTHIPSLVKSHWIYSRSSRNKNTDGWQMDQHEIIMSHHYRVAGYNNWVGWWTNTSYGGWDGMKIMKLVWGILQWLCDVNGMCKHLGECLKMERWGWLDMSIYKIKGVWPQEYVFKGHIFVCIEVLRPSQPNGVIRASQPNGVIRAWSVYLTTH